VIFIEARPAPEDAAQRIIGAVYVGVVGGLSRLRAAICGGRFLVAEAIAPVPDRIAVSRRHRPRSLKNALAARVNCPIGLSIGLRPRLRP
jgi:hypothetical protein